MRFLFGTPLGSGPLRPLIPRLRSLLARGHEVILLSDPGAAANPELAGIPVYELPSRESLLPGWDEHAHKRAAEALPPAQRGMREVQDFVRWGEALLPHVLKIVDEFRPDALVDDFAFLAGWLASAVRGLPRATQMLVPLSQRWLAERMAAPFDAALARAGGTGSAATSLGNWLELYPMPPAWFEGFALPPHALAVRPCEPEPMDDGQVDALLGDLGTKHPLVYMTLGTVWADSPGLFAEVLRGAAATGADLIATTGPTVDPSTLGALPPNVRVARFVPQSLLLPRCAALIGNAGFGSTMGALARGVPIVAVPLASGDHPLNARRIEALGVGRIVAESDRSAAAVSDALVRVLDEPGYRERAQALAREIAALPPVDEVSGLLEQIARRQPYVRGPV